MNAVSLFPPNGATNVCPDTHLQITFDAAPAVTNGQIIIYTAAGTPVDTNDLSLGNVERRKIGGTGAANYYVYQVIANGTTATIYPHTGVLAYHQTYYVTITPGTFTNNTSGAFAGISDPNFWRFTTKPSGPPAGTTDLVVAADDSGDFATVQGALDFLPYGNTQPVLIQVRDGVYQEIVYVNHKSDVTIRGESRHGTVIVYPNNNNLSNNGGSSVRTLCNVVGSDDAFENLTLTNSTPHGGSQAEALRVSGQRFIFNNGDLDSYQDTFMISGAGNEAYIYNSHIQGDTDFIWGDGAVVFQNCEIEAMNSAYNCQMRTPSRSYYGAVFLDCSLTKAYNFTGHYLNRIDPSQYPYSAVAYINCGMDTHIAPVGWKLDNTTSPTAFLRFWEYQSTDLTGNLLDVSQRALYSRQLTAAQADAMRNLTNVFGWLPQLAPNIISQPTNETVAAGGNAAFAVSATGIETENPTNAGGASIIVPLSYQWLKDSTALADATNSTLTITNVQRSDMANYSVVVTNLAGSMTSSVVTLTVTGLKAEFIGEATDANGSLVLNFAGLPDTTYWLEIATNLAPPVNWLPIATNVADADGLWQFTDSQTTNYPVRFYRAVQQ